MVCIARVAHMFLRRSRHTEGSSLSPKETGPGDLVMVMRDTSARVESFATRRAGAVARRARRTRAAITESEHCNEVGPRHNEMLEDAGHQLDEDVRKV